MGAPLRQPSTRQEELLESAYRYVLDHGLTDMSLRPLAAAIGSSPRVLLFLFGSKDGLIRALLARARADELALLEGVGPRTGEVGLAPAVRATWSWLSDAEHRQLLVLWVQAYARSLTDPAGPWADFAQRTVQDWLAILASAQPPARRRTRAAMTERTLALTVLRGALLDLLATGDVTRTTAAVTRHLDPFVLEPIGRVESTLTDPGAAPRQPDEGAPSATIVLDPHLAPAAQDLRPGDPIVVVTWLHQARRDELLVHPRDDRAVPRRGVFSTRSQDRPNPIGLHDTTVVAVDGVRITVEHLEVIDQTPVLDIKPILEPLGRR